MNAIEIRDLSVCFASRRSVVHAIRELNLDVAEGRVFGFLGPNGAGKTTTMHVLLGFLSPTSGSAYIFGEDVRRTIARERIGYLPENPETYRYLSGRELLHMAGRLFRLSGRPLRERTNRLIEELGLSAVADRLIATYSRGMRQRICLAQALINNPDLLILDEPTAGLDPLARLDIRRLILRLREEGKTVFFSSHELSEVELVCDHLAIMAGGRLAIQGPANQLVPPGESLEKFFVRIVSQAQGTT